MRLQKGLLLAVVFFPILKRVLLVFLIINFEVHDKTLFNGAKRM